MQACGGCKSLGAVPDYILAFKIRSRNERRKRAVFMHAQRHRVEFK